LCTQIEDILNLSTTFGEKTHIEKYWTHFQFIIFPALPAFSPFWPPDRFAVSVSISISLALHLTQPLKLKTPRIDLNLIVFGFVFSIVALHLIFLFVWFFALIA